MFDTIIKNARIADGTGAPIYFGSVAIKSGKIVMVGDLGNVQAAEVIEANGQVLSPGFIDVHTHNDLMLLTDNSCQSKLQQGVTTQIVGNCGFSVAPIRDETLSLLRTYAEPSIGIWEGVPAWHSFEEYLRVLGDTPLAGNVGAMVGNGTVRMAVKGFDKSPFTSAETDHAKAYLAEAFEAGAVGMSMGLTYTPEHYYTTEELIPLCAVAEKYNRPVAVHMRGEGDSLMQSIDEMLHIAEQTGISLHISHMKAAGKNNWGKMSAALEKLDKARAKGIDVTGDVYSYTACYSQFPYLMPPWAAEGGVAKAVERVRDPETFQRIKANMERSGDGWDCMIYSTGWENVWIALTVNPSCKQYEGMSVAEIAQLRGENPTECGLRLFAENDGKLGFMFFFIDEADIKSILCWDHAFSASDSTSINSGICHPRVFGNSVRLLSHFVREEHTLSLESAIQKLTGMPAKRFGLNGKGLLRPGMDADLVLFNPETIQDCADYDHPQRYPKGISQVLVAGKSAMQSGNYQNTTDGKLITIK